MHNLFHSTITNIVRFFTTPQAVNTNYATSSNYNENSAIKDTVSEHHGNNKAPKFSGMKKKFISEVHWREKTRIENYFNIEYEKRYDFFLQKIEPFQNENGFMNLTTVELVDLMISIKYDAIINTLRLMKKNPNKTEDFGIFNEIFSEIKDNDLPFDELISNKNISLLLLNKIVAVMENAQKEFKEREAREPAETLEPDQFETILFRYGINEENGKEWNQLFDRYRYDYYQRSKAI